MRYLLLIADAETSAAREETGMNPEYAAFMKDIAERGVLQGGERLRPTADATTVRVRDGEVLTTDGPFAETKEALAGYFLVDCKEYPEQFLSDADPVSAVSAVFLSQLAKWQSLPASEKAAAITLVIQTYKAFSSELINQPWPPMLLGEIESLQSRVNSFERRIERWQLSGLVEFGSAWQSVVGDHAASDTMEKVRTTLGLPPI